jgi:hypothetical protein
MISITFEEQADLYRGKATAKAAKKTTRAGRAAPFAFLVVSWRAFRL